MKRTLVCMAVVVVACGGSDEAASNEGLKRPRTQTSGPQGNASVTGTVSFAGACAANPTIDMNAEASAKRSTPARSPIRRSS